MTQEEIKKRAKRLIGVQLVLLGVNAWFFGLAIGWIPVADTWWQRFCVAFMLVINGRGIVRGFAVDAMLRKVLNENNQ